MTIQQALQKASEGGYNAGHPNSINVTAMMFLFDSEFWQSLAKTMSWKKLACGDCYSQDAFPHYEADQCIYCLAIRERRETETWKAQWHRMVDELSEGKSIEDFFKDL